MVRFIVGLLLLITMVFMPLPSAFRLALLIFGAALTCEGVLILLRGGVLLEELYEDPFWKYFLGFTAERRALGGAFVLGGLFTLAGNIWIALIALLIGGALIASEFFFPLDDKVVPHVDRIGQKIEAQIKRITS